MFDSKVKEKKRKKLNALVQQRMAETDSKDETLVRKQIMQEQRKKSKDKKKGELETIKKQVREEFAGKEEEEKVIEKAIQRAVAKFHSKKKKAKNPKLMLKNKANALIINENSKLWCPRDQSWWDSDCQDKFDDLQFLAGCWNINLTKGPQNFAEIYPEMCKEYFDVLAKKRFNSDEKSESGPVRKKNKSVLEKKYEEKKAKAENENNNKGDHLILKEVLDEMLEQNKALKFKEIKKSWKPTHKPYFDKECSEEYEKLTELAVKQGLDLESNAGDFKKFRKRNKASCISYFKLLDDKREGLDDKQKKKKEKKKKEASQKNASPTTISSTAVNKKITFDDEIPNESKEEKENKQPFDVEKTIKKVDKKLKKGLKRKNKD